MTAAAPESADVPFAIVRLIVGDVRDRLRQLASESVDANATEVAFEQLILQNEGWERRPVGRRA